MSLIGDQVNQISHPYRKQVGSPINLLTRLQLAVLNALWKITCGERYKHDDKRLLDILKKTGAYVFRNYSRHSFEN